jgi:hypothetical protein
MNKMTSGRRLTFGIGTLAGAVLASLLAVTAPGNAATLANAPTNASPPAITGTATPGDTLTASSGSWNGDTPITFGFQWRLCNSSGNGCSDIAGANGQTHNVGTVENNSTLRVLVTATNAAGTATAESDASAVVAPVGASPQAAAQGTVTGTLQVGKTLTVDPGNWTGTTPITFTYRWQRCDTGGHCADITGATTQTYVAAVTDIGYRLRALVSGRNSVGSDSLYSNLTSAAIAAVGSKPALIIAPVVSGTPQVGAPVTATPGTWSSTTAVGYAYAWLRCDLQGNSCAPISGATGNTRTLTAASTGHTIRAQVTATNQGGSSSAQSIPYVVAAAPTGPVAPSGLIPLSDGHYSVAAAAVTLPARLIISGVSFAPSRLTSRAPFTARFRVMDTRGYAVRDALVYLVALPYGWTRGGAEVTTDTACYASIVVRPTARLPLHNSSLVMFVRARTQGGNLLAGVSTRRLVQVLIGR